MLQSLHSKILDPQHRRVSNQAGQDVKKALEGPRIVPSPSTLSRCRFVANGLQSAHEQCGCSLGRHVCEVGVTKNVEVQPKYSNHMIDP